MANQTPSFEIEYARITNSDITRSINKAMKADGKYSKWKYSHVGTFIAILAQEDVKVSDCTACIDWFRVHYHDLINGNLQPTISTNIEGKTLINFSIG